MTTQAKSELEHEAINPADVIKAIQSSVGWLVGCFGFNGPLRQYFSLYRAISQREGEEKRIDR